MDKSEVIKNILKSKEYCPCLLLGRYATEFKKFYRDKIFMVNDLDAVRNVVNNYSGIEDLEGRYFVMDGVGFLSDIGQNSLLKFIEESKFPIVLLSYYDKVSPIIMSRVKFVFKESPAKVTNLKFVKPSACIEYVTEKEKSSEDFTETDRINYYADNCPIMYYYENRLPFSDGMGKRLTKLITELI